MEIRIKSQDISFLKILSKKTKEYDEKIELKFKPENDRFRDATVLVAMITSSAALIGVIIQAIFSIKKGIMKISGKDWSVELPSNYSKTDIEKIVNLAKGETISIDIEE